MPHFFSVSEPGGNTLASQSLTKIWIGTSDPSDLENPAWKVSREAWHGNQNVVDDVADGGGSWVVANLWLTYWARIFLDVVKPVLKEPVRI
jgi:hypothetical protein